MNNLIKPGTKTSEFALMAFTLVVIVLNKKLELGLSGEELWQMVLGTSMYVGGRSAIKAVVGEFTENGSPPKEGE